MKFGNVIVTGGAGFLGSHLVDSLVSVSKSVTVIDNRKPRKLNKNKKASYKHVDIRSEEILEIFKKVKPDIVFHLAAHIHDRESQREPVMNAENNVIGSLNVFEAVRQYGQGKIIFASSSIIYGNQSELPISEEAVPMPVTPYAISQLTCERYLHFYENVYGTKFTVLRMGNIYGPRQDDSAESGAVGIFAARLLKGQQVYINNDGETTRDYAYVSDAVRSMMMAADSDYVGVLNIGGGNEYSTNKIFELVRDEVGTQADSDFREHVEDVVKNISLDIKKAKQELMWEPEVGIGEGIEKTVEWYREFV